MEFDGDNEQGFLMGAASGAAAGGMAGGPWGAAAGAVIGGALGYVQANKQRKATKKAQRNAEAARVASVTRQFGAKQQADSIMASTLMRPMNGGSGQQSRTNSSTGLPAGVIGSNLPSSSGTF